MFRTLCLLAFVFIAAFFSTVLWMAHAGQGGDNPLSVLMQDYQRRLEAESHPPPAQRMRQHRTHVGGSPLAAPLPAVAPATPPVAPPTRFVAVFGDSLAEILAGGLADDLADRSDIGIHTHVKASSGLVRDDFFDWPKAIQDIAGGGEHIDAAVVMIGINDAQPLNEAGIMLAPFSDDWDAAYSRRIAAILAALKAKNIPTFWVGLPPMQDSRLNISVSAINDIARQQVERGGGRYVDLWDGFVDQDGQYAATGPDLSGQPTKLRTSDGVHFTQAGADVAAHYVDTELRRALGDAPVAVTPLATLTPEVPAPSTANAMVQGPSDEEADLAAEARKPAAGPVQRLDVQTVPGAPDGGGLLGGGGAPAAMLAGADPTMARVLIRGEPLAPKEGRADDFRWPRPALAR